MDIIAPARECTEYMPRPTEKKTSHLRIGRRILSRDFPSESLIEIYNYHINETFKYYDDELDSVKI